MARVFVTASLLLALMPFSRSQESNLKAIVETSMAGISWQEFQRLSGPERMNDLVRIGSALAHVQPRQAWSSVKELQSLDDREFLMRGVLLEQAQADPAAALRELEELAPGGERTLLARAFFGRWP